MTEQMRDLDQALRDLPLHQPAESSWQAIADQLERNDISSIRNTRWLWSSVAACVVIFNIAFIWQSQVSDDTRLTASLKGGYPGRPYSTQRSYRTAVLRQQINQLDQLMPYGSLEQQLEMYEYRNELSDRLVSVKQPVSIANIRL